MTNYNDGKWHGWNGGECPVHPETVVVVQLGWDTRINVDKDTSGYTECAGSLRWTHIGGGGDIIFFRVVKEHKEPREFWVDPHDKRAYEHYVKGGIHVREVQP